MHPLIAAHQPAIADLCRRYGVARLEVFGSATGDGFDPHRSDVDFLVEFDARPGVNLFNAYLDLRHDLAALLGRPVDLVMPGAIDNPVVRETINASRELIYAA